MRPCKRVAVALAFAMSMLLAGAPAMAEPLGSASDSLEGSSVALDEEGVKGGVSVSQRGAVAMPDPVSPSDAAPMAVSSASSAFPVPVSGIYHQQRAYEMLAMVNAERQRVGAPTLSWDAGLEAAAMQRAMEISVLTSHTRPDGSSCSTAFPEGLFTMGENIAGGRSAVSQTYEDWKTSPGHYQNMVDETFTKVGIACVEIPGSEFGYYWVQCFGAGGDIDPTCSSIENEASTCLVPLPDSIVTGTEWSATSLTPGVESLRALPVVKGTFDGTITDGIVSSSVNGDVSYDASFFSWKTENPEIAAFWSDGSAGYLRGVSAGYTTISADLSWGSAFDKAFGVTVSQEGAFTDVGDRTDHRSDVFWLSGTGVTAGYPDGSFKPYATVARCDMAAFLRRLAVSMGVSEAATFEPTADDWGRFGDVNPNTPHASDILWLAKTGITSGFADGGFHPYAEVVRCDMAAFLRRMAKLANRGDASNWSPADADWDRFGDIARGSDHAEDVLWLAHAGVAKGFADGAYRPFAQVVRCDMASFLHGLYSL